VLPEAGFLVKKDAMDFCWIPDSAFSAICAAKQRTGK
jgi:hypothetical protein